MINVHLTPVDLEQALRSDVRTGMTDTPKHLPPKWFYDDRGSELFDQITRLPEYYPTEREREILGREAANIAERSGADTLVELGSGTSDKTRLLLDALDGSGALRRFIPFDVSEGILRWAAASIAERHPALTVHGVVGDFERHLDHIPGGGRRMVAFLGGTIGNLGPSERHKFLSDLSSNMAPGDSLLLGTDLVKDPERLVRAYDDSAGVTADFNRNVLHVLNRELGGTFEPERFSHVARWNGDEERIEMWLRSDGAQEASIAALDMEVSFGDGEEIHTEISTKFRRQGVEDELAGAGLELRHWWTDEADDFAVSLSFRE